MAIIYEIREKLKAGQNIFRRPSILQLVDDYAVLEFAITKMRVEYATMQEKLNKIQAELNYALYGVDNDPVDHSDDSKWINSMRAANNDE